MKSDCPFQIRACAEDPLDDSSNINYGYAISEEYTVYHPTKLDLAWFNSKKRAEAYLKLLKQQWQREQKNK